MTLGPIDFVVLEFPGNKFTGQGLYSLLELVQAEIIRIIDLVVIVKDQDGKVFARELTELDPDNILVLDPLKIEAMGLITVNDVESIAALLTNNSSAGLLLIENFWAVKTKQAFLDAGARLVLFDRLPNELVEENLADIEALGATDA